MVVCIFSISMVTLGFFTIRMSLPFLQAYKCKLAPWWFYFLPITEGISMGISFYSWISYKTNVCTKINAIIQSPLYCYTVCEKISFFSKLSCTIKKIWIFYMYRKLQYSILFLNVLSFHQISQSHMESSLSISQCKLSPSFVYNNSIGKG